MQDSCQFVGKKVSERVLTTYVKDGIWAVLAWLSIIAFRNKVTKPGEKPISVSDVVLEHWATYWRNFFSRYDNEKEQTKCYSIFRDLISKSKAGEKYGSYTLRFADDFTYTDPVDGSVVSKQGIRFVFTDGSWIIYRLSGTGSASATVRNISNNTSRMLLNTKWMPSLKRFILAEAP